MRMFFENREYVPVTPRQDDEKYHLVDRLILYHDGHRGPIIRWADTSFPVAGWVIGEEPKP